jgi:hypothetical protein
MSEEQDDQERPCLHCMMVELINDFYAEYPSRDEGVDAIAKTVAEITSGQKATLRQQIIQLLMRQIMEYDAEFRRDDTAGVSRSDARH